jgi:hypothetical protein
MSFFDSLQKFDAFAKAQDDFRTRTVTGGIISIGFTGLLVLFSIIEWMSYRELGWTSEINVDNSIQEEVTVGIDVSFPKVPCLCIDFC